MNAVGNEYTPRGAQKRRGHWRATMNKRLNGAAYSVPLNETENAQNQHPHGNTRFAQRSGLGRRSATASKQQAKNQECYAIDVAGFDALHTGRYSEAELYARHVITMTHGYDPLAPELLAFALDAQDRTKEALDAYKLLADRGGDFPRILLPYARLLLQTGQWAQAVVVYNKQLPNLSLGDLVRANSHFSPDTQRPEELATAIQIAQGLTCTAGEGWGLHSQDEEAMEHFHQAAALEPSSPLTNYYLGYGLKRLGRQAEAQAAFRKAATLGQGDVKAAAEKELPEPMRPK
jgi:tetratricopeptide (TPR) repeat protein